MRKSRKMALVAGAVASLMIAGVAFASWTATGGGSGSAKAISSTPLTTVDVSSSTVAQLYPGKTDGDLKVKFHNGNPYPVRIVSLLQDTSLGHWVSSNVASDGCTDDPSALVHPTGVSFAGYTANGTTLPYLDVAASSDSATFTLVGTVGMTNVSDNNCQGATFTIPVIITSAASNA